MNTFKLAEIFLRALDDFIDAKIANGDEPERTDKIDDTWRKLHDATQQLID